MSAPVACLDVGSTFTKGLLVDPDSGAVTARAQAPTTALTDVMTGADAVLAQLGATAPTPVLACSSAGGGLRLAVVGYERAVTAEAGYQAGLSAGAKVVHVEAGPLDPAGVTALHAARPDIVLLVGGTDGGNAEVLVHNAHRLAGSHLTVDTPVVVAGNTVARHEVADILGSRGRPYLLADNVLPAIGTVAPTSARGAIREAFVRHVIGGGALSRDPRFARMVRAATPDAVLRGVEVLADTVGCDVLVVDVGGATTDVYSSVTPTGEDAMRGPDIVAPLRCTRTVEGDLGVRWNADGVLAAAAREGLAHGPGLPEYAVRVANEPSHLPAPSEIESDVELARLCAVVAVRRHARPAGLRERARPLSGVSLILGSGGVIRHADEAGAAGVLRAVADDRAGGWTRPRSARLALDTAYRLCAVGLLAEEHPAAAARLAWALPGPD
ncbi:MAG: glutamate mutase L [Dermatophilaceae bacterium]